MLTSVMLGPKALNDAGIAVSRDGGKRSAYDALSLPGVDLDVVVQAIPAYQNVERELLVQLQIDSTYDKYSDRQAKEVADLRRLADHYAHAVVNEKAIADLRARMNFDAGEPAPQV